MNSRWRILLSAFLVTAGASLSGGDPPDAFDKDEFRSRKKWYVSFVLQLKGKSESTQTEGKDEWTVKWNILREIRGTMEYDEVRSGANSRPRNSKLAAGEMSEDRFTSWEPSVHPSTVEWMINDRVEHTSSTHGQHDAVTEEWGFTKLAGAGVADIHNTDGLSCDLKDMIYDIEVNLNANDKKRGEPKALRLIAEYHSFTPATTVRRDVEYPLREHRTVGALPKLTESLEMQLRSRKLEMFKGRILVFVTEPVNRLPGFPDSSSSQNSTARNFGGASTGNGTPLELSLEMALSPTPPSVAKLILKPVGYDTWRPLCSSSEFVKGNELPVEWRVEEEGGDASRPAKVTRVEFALLETSAEPGVCMNWPVHLTTETPDFDLRFNGSYPPPAGHEVRSKGQILVLSDAPAEAGKGTVKVECFDSGATGVLVSEATLDDGRKLRGTVEATGKAELMIPDWERGVSHIARYWREAMAEGKKDDVDDDNFPEGDGQHGDGLTVWEEYRGFWVGGALDTFCAPQIKDLFICNRIGGKAYGGIDVFREATKLIVHDKLRPEEFKDDRVINFHHAARPHEVDQHGINLWEGGYYGQGEDGAVSEASMCVEMRPGVFPGPPKNTYFVTILPSMLDQPEQIMQYSNGEGWRTSYTDVTISHELGHGLGIRHHGSGDTTVTWRFEKLASGELITTVDGKRVVVRLEQTGDVQTLLNYARGPIAPGFKEITVTLGVPHGQMSGDVTCFMRYDTAHAYRSKADPNEFYVYWDQEVWGDRLCASAEGNGCNSPTHQPQSRYGDAAPGRGNCLHKFVVNDKWESKNK
jgi:hypothetical protein